MITRRAFIGTVAGGLLASAPFAVGAQQPANTRRVGVLAPGSASGGDGLSTPATDHTHSKDPRSSRESHSPLSDRR
jgi:hypothetical protein